MSDQTEMPQDDGPKIYTQRELDKFMMKHRRGLQRTIVEQAERLKSLEEQLALLVTMDNPVVVAIMTAIESRFPQVQP